MYEFEEDSRFEKKTVNGLLTRLVTNLQSPVFLGGKMEIIGRILGTYVPLCCVSLPVLGFFAIAAALPVAFLALTRQGKQTGSKK
jgi:hypothetical protein